MALLKMKINLKRKGLSVYMNLNEKCNKTLGCKKEGINFGIGSYTFDRDANGRSVADENRRKMSSASKTDITERKTENGLECPSTMTCGICNKSRKITNFCFACDTTVCFLCEDNHWKNNHDLVRDIHSCNSGNMNFGLCRKHRGYHLDMFCLLCRKYMCVVCKLLVHVKHDFLDLSDENASIAPAAEETCNKLNYNLNEKTKITMATGVNWNVCEMREREKLFLTIPCCLI